MQSAVDRPPRLAGVIGSERARSRDRDEDSTGVARIQNDAVQAHPAGARLPGRPCSVATQSGDLLPRLTPVRRAKQGGVLNSGVDSLGIGQRGFEMPDSLELPRTRRAVVPLVSGQRRAGFRRRVVDELIALAL